MSGYPKKLLAISLHIASGRPAPSARYKGQTGSLGLQVQSLPTQAQNPLFFKSAQADFVRATPQVLTCRRS